MIRPLIYVNETLSTEYAAAQGFLPIAFVCSEKESVRREIREFLDSMRSRHARISESMMAAMGNVNLYTLLGENARRDAVALLSGVWRNIHAIVLDAGTLAGAAIPLAAIVHMITD